MLKLGTLKDGDEATIAEMLPKGYTHIHVPRDNHERGGGIIVVYKDHLDLRKVDSTASGTYQQFEYADCILKVDNQQVRVVTVYRPPQSKKNGLKVSKFWREWTKFLGKLTSVSYEIIIFGDINFHLDIKEEAGTKRFNSIIEEFGLFQHVDAPTHIKQHTLDIAITYERSSLISELEVVDPVLVNKQGSVLKDHFALQTVLNIMKPLKAERKIKCRNLNSIDYASLKSQLVKSPLLDFAHTDSLPLTELVNLYNITLSNLLDKFAPLQTKTIIEEKNSPWYTKEQRQQKRLLRRKERLYRKTKLTVHQEAYHQQASLFCKNLKKARIQYCSSKVEECGSDQKKLFKITNSLMGRKSMKVLPKTDSDLALANDFMTYFNDKTKQIHRDLKLSIEDTGSEEYNVLTMESFSSPIELHSFEEAAKEEVRKMIMESSNKQCLLDPMPTWLIKILLDILLPVIMLIINKSLVLAEVPASLKTALLRPLLKDRDLDWNAKASYRPVSNLPYLSKLLEKVVHSRLEKHLRENNLNDPDQTAYSKYNSTETALLRIQSDILENMDCEKATLLVMLDISAAYDTIDHKIFLQRLQSDFSITGNALKWMKSYLGNR